MPHFGVVGWCVVALVVTFVLGGAAAAATMGRTIASTGGGVSGIIVGGIPVFADHFGQGLNQMTGNNGNGATFTFDRQAGTQQPRQQRDGVTAARDGGNR